MISGTGERVERGDGARRDEVGKVVTRRPRSLPSSIRPQPHPSCRFCISICQSARLIGPRSRFCSRGFYLSAIDGLLNALPRARCRNCVIEISFSFAGELERSAQMDWLSGKSIAAVCCWLRSSTYFRVASYSFCWKIGISISVRSQIMLGDLLVARWIKMGEQEHFSVARSNIIVLSFPQRRIFFIFGVCIHTSVRSFLGNLIRHVADISLLPTLRQHAIVILFVLV